MGKRPMTSRAVLVMRVNSKASTCSAWSTLKVRSSVAAKGGTTTITSSPCLVLLPPRLIHAVCHP